MLLGQLEASDAYFEENGNFRIQRLSLADLVFKAGLQGGGFSGVCGLDILWVLWMFCDIFQIYNVYTMRLSDAF
jgi:hypothetical protein